MRHIARAGSRSRLVHALAMLSLLTVVSGCTFLPSITVGIDGIGSGGNLAQSRYTLKSAVAGVDETDLHFLEYSAHIDAALAKRGMLPATAREPATVEIAVNYGTSRQQRTVTTPFRNDDFFRPPRQCLRRNDQGTCTEWVRRHRDPFRDPFHSPRYTVVTSYRTFITLEARAIDSNDSQPALWATRARTSVATPDIRATLPLLLVAASDYIGTNTGREVTVVLRADDPALQQATLAPGPAGS